MARVVRAFGIFIGQRIINDFWTKTVFGIKCLYDCIGLQDGK